MKTPGYIIVAICMVILHSSLEASDTIPCVKESLVGGATSGMKFYVGLVHQHENFFHKPFSYQGVEAGMINDRSMIFGVTGSTFIYNLNVEKGNAPAYIFLSKVGVLTGFVRKPEKILHAGCLLNFGCFSLKGDNTDFPVFERGPVAVNKTGLVISPQVFCEVNAFRWMRIRTGLDYNFYRFVDRSSVCPHDLQGFSVSFGFLFGGV